MTNIISGICPGDSSPHFLLPWGESSFRSLCEAHTVYGPYLIRTDQKVVCNVCTGRYPLEENPLTEEEVKMSGSEPEITNEEYMTFFNRAVNEGEELKYYLPAVKDLNPEELVDHINMINKFALRIRVAKQAVKKTLEARRIHLNAEQREALRLRDMQYKPKPVPKEGEVAKKPRRAAGTAKTVDAVENIMNLLGISREKAEAKLAKLQAKLGE